MNEELWKLFLFWSFYIFILKYFEVFMAVLFWYLSKSIRKREEYEDVTSTLYTPDF